MKKKFSLCIAGHIVYIALNTMVVISIFRHEYVSAFFDLLVSECNVQTKNVNNSYGPFIFLASTS